MNEVFERESLMARWDSDYYHPIALWLYDQAVLDMLQLMDVEAGATILDAGCGPGEHSIRVARAGFHVCAVDISASMLEHTRRRAKSAGVLDSVEFHREDLTQLGFASASFEYVFSWGVVIHIPEAGKALDELARIIKPGGKLALYLTNSSSLDYKTELVARSILRRFPDTRERLPLGERALFATDCGRLCVWHFELKAVTDHMERKGLRLRSRRIGELSEMQRHFKGPIRYGLLRINNLAYRLNLPACLGVGNLLVFEKDYDKVAPA